MASRPPSRAQEQIWSVEQPNYSMCGAQGRAFGPNTGVAYVAIVTDRPSFERYKLMALLGGAYCSSARGEGWLSYHLQCFPATPFGQSLQTALAVCEEKVPGLGFKLMRELAQVKFDRDDRRLYEQLLQKLAEVAVLRALLEADWPGDAVFQHEPKAPNGKRPELMIETGEALYLFEVKCPALLQHKERRLNSLGQYAARTFPADALRGMKAIFDNRVTLPRDQTLADFLASAEEKFSSFPTVKQRHGLLIVLWDTYMYEAISPLVHEMSGLLGPTSWKREADGGRVRFTAVDGVVVLNHFDELMRATGGAPPLHRSDPFSFSENSPLPGVWCANMGGKDLSQIVSAALDVVPVDAMSTYSDYKALDTIIWFNA